MALIKVCGITNIEDALTSVQYGASMLGFVFADSPRQVDIDTVKHIKRILGGDVKTVGVFTEEDDCLIRIMDECELDYAQLHGRQSEEFAQRIGSERVIRVARVSDKTSVDTLSQYESAAYYLLDTYKKGITGGTGATFDWLLALRAKSLCKPLILSGGLNPSNAADAIRIVRPFAVDVSSGVESSPGCKDHKKIKEFIDNVREADNVSR